MVYAMPFKASRYYNLTRAATVSVRRATTRELSVRDTKRFLALLAKPPAPSQALRAAARRAAKLAKSR